MILSNIDRYYYALSIVQDIVEARARLNATNALIEIHKEINRIKFNHEVDMWKLDITGEFMSDTYLHNQKIRMSYLQNFMEFDEL